MAHERRYLAVDLGAASGRVMLGSWDGARFGLSELHRFGNDPVTAEGRRHWDVLRLWHEIGTGLAKAAGSGGDAPSGIGVDTWGVDYALLDRDGRLLGNPSHYRDRRTDGITAAIDARIDPVELFARTGIQPMQINTLVQLASMVLARDPQLDAAARLVPIPSLFMAWLGAGHVAEYTHASTTQCLDARERAWARDLLERLAIPTRLLPEIVPPATVLAPMREDVAHEAGLRARPAVIAIGTHDTASAVAAIPGLGPGRVYLSSGTWSLMGMELREPILADRARTLGFTNEGGVDGTIRFHRNITGLWLAQECRRAWAREGTDRPWDELLALAGAAPAFGAVIDPDAPEFLGPDDMPAAIRDACRATGQRPPATQGEIVRTCLESIAVRYRATLDELEALGGEPVESIHVVGGGSRNRLLCQLTADACRRPVVAGPAEATALGNVMVQAIATGEIRDVASGRAAVAESVERETYEPRDDGRWDEALGRLREVERQRATA